MLKKMHPRLHSVLTLFLAFFMLSASMQSVLCELTCGLGEAIACHGSAAAEDKAMTGMHCSGMTSVHPAESSSNSVQIDGLAQGLCQHPSPVLAADSSSRSEKAQAVHWVVVEPVVLEPSVLAYHAVANSNAPPLLPPTDRLNVSLRI